MASKVVMLFLYLGLFIHFIYAVPERGIKEMVFDMNHGQYKSFAKSLFKDAKITINGIVIKGDPKTKIKSLSLNWYLLRSDCAQYFVQVKEDILSALIVPANQDPKAHPLHTMYSKGVLTFNNEHLHNKTVVTLEREIPKQKETSAEAKEETSAEAKKETSAEGKEETSGQAKKKTGQAKTKIPGHAKTKIPGHAKTKTPEKKTRKTHKMKKEPTEQIKNAHEDTRKKREAAPVKSRKKGDKTPHKAVQTIAPTTAMKGPPKAAGLDGNYLLVISLKKKLPKDVGIQVKVSIKMNTGYLSAAEWPLLPFYGAMSLVYLAYGVVWLIVSACQWRELLRIQFWIGGVIALGMLEKAVLFSEYNNVNDTGIPAHGLVVLALVLSCIKRTLSRILIIIVSMGFGIVKPRLGSALHRVLGVGCLYFILSVIEGSYREFSVKADVNRKQVIASVPLSVLDAVICWWIFMSLLQTMRTLRIRKNLVKLSLYRHFTNILVVSVIASVAFMAWVIKAHSFNSCIKDWKEIWIDDAFWHFLFALILLAIMVLWRPTVNNQRYAFTPLIDVGEEDDDDMTLSDAFQGMKMRGKGEGETPSRADKQRKKAEDDLKWVEENIPTSGGIDTALPSLLDSDEEMMTTKLEMNKME